MLSRLYFFLICLVFSTSTLVSCDEKEDPATQQQRACLHGRWLLVQGFRNGNPTETLTGVYFQFDSTGKMQTNLPVGAEEMVACQFKMNEVIQQFSEKQKVVYQIKSISDSALVITTLQRGIQLEMQMGKDTVH